MLKSRLTSAQRTKERAAVPSKRTNRSNQTNQNTLLRRKKTYRERLTQKENERASLGLTYNEGFNTGFAKGFEDGHQAAYEQQL
ncbi:hypothetical protein [Paenibacillus castaneae]|uniref:hypothetical protein n=1 Tax=Paenibacillus castaneae TaxID=474957 RepID=UPI0011AF7CF2|nr:hypothetical protein [Paenibacillus castaneae]